MYIFIKIIHILSFTSWMAGLFYLPRIFVYHAEQANFPGHVSSVFKTMERKLYKFIMFPAMVATWISGLMLAAFGGYLYVIETWLYLKIALVSILSIFHVYCGRWIKIFSTDNNRRSGRFYRLINELPTLLFIGIVVLVVLRPL